MNFKIIKNKGFLVLAVTHISFSVSNLSIAITNDLSKYNYAWGIIMALLLAIWCTIDASQNKKSLPDIYKVLIFMFFPIAPLIYIFTSRKFTQSIKFIGLQLLVFIFVTLIPFIIIGIQLHGDSFLK